MTVLHWASLEVHCPLVQRKPLPQSWPSGELVSAGQVGVSPEQGLGRVALAGAVSADGVGAREPAVPAAVLVGIVAHGAVPEPAGGRVAARVVAAAVGASAVAVLAFLDDAVAALLAGYGLHAPVVRQA